MCCEILTRDDADLVLPHVDALDDMENAISADLVVSGHDRGPRSLQLV
ncbi:MAG: hypothetical protein ACTHU0_28270 [Kofleriaceae bacterium]